MKLYQSSWDAQPERTDLGEQVFLHAASAWDTAVMVSSSRKMFNLAKSMVWARVAAWSEWVQVGYLFIITRYLFFYTIIQSCMLKHLVWQKAPQPTPEQPFPVHAPPGSLRTATTLLSTSRRSPSSSEVLWLRLQILLSADELDQAYTFARDDGFGGGLARAWWRMEGVPIISERMKGKGKDLDWEVEWTAVEQVLKSDTEA